MASITYDGQSFLLDGRRMWLVSGSIHYTRVPRSSWAQRIAQAKHAGLNCIETPLVWARHEPRHNQFDFTGDNDIREFVRLVHQAGLYCILRAGPFIDAGYDLGGLPPWLLSIDNLKLRATNQPFLEACSRYITALAGQLRDMQINSPTPKGSPAGQVSGPIVLLQNESGYTCGDDHLGETYLAELDRYWREAGFTVPIINANELWQSVEGEIDGWTGSEQMLSHLRQLGAIRPAQPRIAIQFNLGPRTTIGTPAAPAASGPAIMRRIAEVLAAGGQFNIDPFHGGSYFGFSAGRDHASPMAGFLATSADAHAPVSESGQLAPSYTGIRRICTFASRFSRVLSHLDPARAPVALLPEPHPNAKDLKAGATSRVAVLHAIGSQGGVVFVFGDEEGQNSPGPMNLLLSDGSTLPVDLGKQSVVWCLLQTRLTGRANLDYCNLCALALVGKVFLCYGAPGARGLLSINGSPLETTVPEGKQAPIIQDHEGVTVVIASQDQVDSIHVADSGVYIGVLDLDSQNKPVVADDARSYTHIDIEGKVTVHKLHHAHSAEGAHPPAKKSARVHLGEWSFASCADYCKGTSPRFAGISKPQDLVALGAPYGYGWYRLKFTSGAAGKVKLMFPHAAHRLHLMLDAEQSGVVGIGPGASNIAQLNLKKGSHTLVVLAENAGRVSSGADLGEMTGLYGHAYEVEPLRVQKPELESADPVDMLAFRAPLWRMQRDDRTDAQRLTWTVPHRSKNPIIMHIGAFEEHVADSGSPLERADGLVLLNGKPVHVFQQGGIRPLVIAPEILLKGNNSVQIAMVGSTALVADALAKSVSFYDAVDAPTMKAEWAFAKWQVPPNDAFGKSAKHTAGEPGWWRTNFTVSGGEHPVLVDCTGLTKGQLYINGKHLGRYFVATETGKKVPPQLRYVVPRALIKDDQNEITIFDEHGASPSRVRILGDASGGAMGR